VALHPLRVPAWPRLWRELLLARAPGRLVASGEFDVVVVFRHALGGDLFQPHGGLHRESLRGAVRAASRGRISRALGSMRKLSSPKNLFFLYTDAILLSRRSPLLVAALSAMSAAPIVSRLDDPARLEVIPNGVDLTRFHPGLRPLHRARLLTELGLAEGTRVGLYCGHNHVLKGLKEALYGLAAYRRRGGDLVLLVAGRSSGRRYQRRASKLGLAERVIFLGERGDMHRLFGASDVLVHPTWYDPCSLVVLEALGSGVPVVTTRFNGAAELMSNGRDGIVLRDPSDSEALGEALERVLDGDHERFREQAAHTGRRNGFSVHVDRMEDLMLRIARTGSARPALP